MRQSIGLGNENRNLIYGLNLTDDALLTMHYFWFDTPYKGRFHFYFD